MERIALLGGGLDHTRLEEYAFGPWRFAFDGAVRYVWANGVEVLRGIELLSRDPNWGVYALISTGVTAVERPRKLVLRYEARSGPGAPRVALDGELVAAADELCFTVRARAEEPVDTARTGFAVLHPIEGFAGAAVEASLRGEDIRRIDIPQLVRPDQPVRAFDRLVFDTPAGGRLQIGFEADVPFEMEDQRNWTDASFKTYVRPLSMPWPYRIEADKTVVQTVRLRLLRPPAQRPVEVVEPNEIVLAPPAPAPQRSIVWLASDPPPAAPDRLADMRPERLEAHIDLRRTDGEARAEEAAVLARRLEARLHLRLIVPDEGDLGPGLARIAERAGHITSVMALPAAYLRSYQPDGAWPETRSCPEALEAARTAFPGVETVEGVLTYFTELNRHPPRAGADAVTFGTAAIVHAADDVSVMETLEALPSVFATARAHAAERPIDLSLAAIALWTNPYGAETVENPDWRRKPLSDRDPRVRGLFGAAWLAGYVAHCAASGIRSVGLGAVSGPLGVLPEGEERWRAAMPDAVVWPIWFVGAALASLGPTVEVAAPVHRGSAAVIAGGARALIANTDGHPRRVAIAGRRIVAARVIDAASLSAALADPDWLARPSNHAAGSMELGPYALALVDLEDA